MKTTIINFKTLAILLLVTVGLAGCGDEEDETKTPSEMLVGRWKLVKIGNNTVPSGTYLTLEINGSFTYEHYDPRKESMVVEEDIYEVLEDWAYDELKKQFSTVVLLGSSSGPFYCTLKEKEMILLPKRYYGEAFFADPTQFFIKVK